jgi:hypothetical protein
MIRHTLKVAAAVLVALGLLLAAPGGGAMAQRGRDKKASSKKQPTKQSSKKATSKNASSRKSAKTAAKKQSSKKSERVAKKGRADSRKSSKKAQSVAKRSNRRVADEPDRTSRRADRRESDATARSASSPARTARTPLVDDEDEGEEDEPAGPRPANKYVASISTARVTEIQNALIQKGVLVGPPTGVYDQTTFQAMTTFQTRNGFGATGMPTAEALKALGVRKNTGVGISSPGRVLETTALDGARETSPSAQPRPSVVVNPNAPQQ